jgi:REP element-mobilizing transposase RayT
MFPAARTFSRWRSWNGGAAWLTAHIDALRTAFRSVHIERPFRVDAIVILPDHLHCIWRLPPDDADFSTLALDQIVFG